MTARLTSPNTAVAVTILPRPEISDVLSRTTPRRPALSLPLRAPRVTSPLTSLAPITKRCVRAPSASEVEDAKTKSPDIAPSSGILIEAPRATKREFPKVEDASTLSCPASEIPAKPSMAPKPNAFRVNSPPASDRSSCAPDSNAEAPYAGSPRRADTPSTLIASASPTTSYWIPNCPDRAAPPNADTAP